MNLKDKHKYKVGEIRYPAYNGTNGFFQKRRWDLITKLNKDGSIKSCKYIWNYATVRVIELMHELESIKGGNKK